MLVAPMVPLSNERLPTPARTFTFAGLFLLVFALTVVDGIAVFRHPALADSLSYIGFSIVLLVVAVSQALLLPANPRASLRVRWYLWVGSLAFVSLAYALAAFGTINLQHAVPKIKQLSFAIGYACAYVVTINPPRSTSWRRLWLVDAAIAAVMVILFFLVFRFGEPAGIYTALIFSIVIQFLFTLGSCIVLRTAESDAVRSLARAMLVFFIFRGVLNTLANLPHVWPGIHTETFANVTSCLPALALAAMPLLDGVSRSAKAPGRPLPPAASVLMTAAILLACLPLLPFNAFIGIALLLVASALFALKVALLQRDFDYERTSLMQSNKQLRELAYTDPVTGIANRRRFTDTAKNALLVARCGFGPHALVLFRLENFQKLTQMVGSRAGERLLCDFAQIVTTTLRPMESHFGRLNEEEFVLILEDTSRDRARQSVEELRDAVPAGEIEFSAGTVVATSSGPDSVERWLADADIDLRRTKLAGSAEHVHS